ncbi:MAG: SdpI family protein [Anaerolineales bacterium]|nr:SdpI family protein [Anaerolineales bacterium]
MNTKTTLVLSLILIGIAVAAGLLAWGQMPGQVASHWNASGQVDGYISRFWGVFLMPVVAAGMLALFLVIPMIDPLKKNIVQFREYFNTFIFLLILFLLYMHALTLAWNLGYAGFNMGTAMLPALGLFLIYAGIMMGKAKRNFFIGIRTPWTLSSDMVWDKTHQAGSKLFIAAGIIAVLGVFFGALALWFLMVPLFAATIFLVGYSYVLYRKEELADQK